MIKLHFYKKNEKFVGFECSGHSGYAEEGQDIVCSAISSLLQSACLGIIDVLKMNAKVKEAEAFLKLELVEEPNEKSQIILETAYLSAKNIASDYKQFVKVN